MEEQYESNKNVEINYDKVLELATDIGYGLLACGGSVSRVETAVDRICSAYGAEEVNVAAFASMIIASIRIPDGREFSYMKRVYSTSNNLALLERYNQLSRDICREKYPLDEALKMCFEVAHSKIRNKWYTVIGACLVAAFYSVFFGGTIADCLPAFIVAFAMSMINKLLAKRSLNAYATTFILSVVGGMLSVSLCKLLVIMGLPCHGSQVMIGTIMILIPGLLTTNAVRDLFTGDLMSGTFSLLNGLLLAVVIAAGYSVSMLVLRSIADFLPPPVRTGWEYYLYVLISGTLGALAVSIFFNVKTKRLVWTVLASMLALGVYLIMHAFLPADMGNAKIFVSYLVASLFAAIISEVLARFIKAPATVVLAPAIIAFVPGSSLYYTMSAIVWGDMASASQNGISCLLTLLGLAVGICAATIIFQLVSPVTIKYYKKSKLAYNLRKKKYGGDADDNTRPEDGKRTD